jgi:hypothetical protein
VVKPFIMFGRTVKQLAVPLVVLMLLGAGLAAGYDRQSQTGATRLPRSFQGARLGMSQYDLMAIAPEAVRALPGAKGRSHRTLAVPAKDRHLQRIEYRLYHGLLRELAIYYKRDLIPRGYEGLLARLKEAYGQPVAENVEEYDLREDVFSVRKTVWKDQATTSELTESRTMREGQEVYELVLTMTDHALQQAYEQDRERLRRQQELSIPIPLAEEAKVKKETAKPGFHGAQSHTTG